VSQLHDVNQLPPVVLQTQQAMISLTASAQKAASREAFLPQLALLQLALLEVEVVRTIPGSNRSRKSQRVRRSQKSRNHQFNNHLSNSRRSSSNHDQSMVATIALSSAKLSQRPLLIFTTQLANLSRLAYPKSSNC
jgi:hypothetical protein